MRFTTHCHVFNLQSVFNEATAFILCNRLRDVHGLPDVVADLVVDKLTDFIRNGGGFTRMTGDDSRFFAHLDPGLIAKAEAVDAALHLAMLENIDMVADDMMAQLGPDVIATPLMMDILVAPQGENAADPVFEAQREATARQIVRYPGRLLPFYAVNPFRFNFAVRMIEALETGGFIGVKLYPSLGYSLEAPGMDAALTYCHARGIPVVMHCNQGGFKQSRDTVAFCAPGLWGLCDNADGYLDRYANLKICFAHFGGQENLLDPRGVPAGSWTETILNLMAAYPGRVFADVSYHDAALDKNSAAVYFANLTRILARPEFRSQVLWGSDTWLLRLACCERDYWGAFIPPGLPAEDFSQIAEINPRAFLGLDADQPGENIVNFMNYMQNKAGWTASEARTWLSAATS